jgi:hypothetical protein
VLTAPLTVGWGGTPFELALGQSGPRCRTVRDSFFSTASRFGRRPGRGPFFDLREKQLRAAQRGLDNMPTAASYPIMGKWLKLEAKTGC